MWSGQAIIYLSAQCLRLPLSVRGGSARAFLYATVKRRVVVVVTNFSYIFACNFLNAAVSNLFDVTAE